MPDRVISVPQAAQIATRIKNKFDNVNGRLDELSETSANILNVTWANARYDQGVYKPLSTGLHNAATVEKTAVKADTPYTVTWDGFNLTSGSVTLYCSMFTDSQTFIKTVSFSLGTNYTRQSKQITTESNAAYIALYTYSSGAAWENLIPINAMITEGTDAPDSYIPPVKLNPNAIDKSDIAEIVNESNIVPETIFNATSRNIAVDAWEPGRYNSATHLPEYRASNNILIRPIMDVEGGATYTLTWGNNEAEAGQVYIREFAGDTYVTSTSIIYAKHKLSVTLSENTTKVGLEIFLSGGTISTMKPDFIQLEKGTASPFVHHKVVSVDRFDLVGAERHNKGCDIPSYYFEGGYLTAKAERIKALMKQAVGHGDAFIFVTDEHWEKNQKKSPALVYYLAENTNINSFIGGGDTADVVSEECCAAFRRAFSGSIHRAAGNHDWFSPATGSLIYYCFDMYNNDQNGNANEHYYYFDNVNQKIRYIVLNAYTTGSGTDNESSSPVTGYTSGQITWVTNVLSESAGMNIIVVTHYMGRTLTNSPNGAEAIRNALDAHNANSETGKVLAVVQGHGHYDALFCTAGGIPIILCTCDKNEPYVSGGTTFEPWLNNRASGTIDEQAFDVDIADTVAKTIHSVRIGAKAMNNYSGSSETGFVSDMTIEERITHYEKITLSSQQTLTASIDDITAWGTSNASVCTVSDGVVSRSGSGVAYVYAINSKGESENWVIVA